MVKFGRGDQRMQGLRPAPFSFSLSLSTLDYILQVIRVLSLPLFSLLTPAILLAEVATLPWSTRNSRTGVYKNNILSSLSFLGLNSKQNRNTTALLGYYFCPPSSSSAPTSTPRPGGYRCSPPLRTPSSPDRTQSSMQLTTTRVTSLHMQSSLASCTSISSLALQCSYGIPWCAHLPAMSDPDTPFSLERVHLLTDHSS